MSSMFDVQIKHYTKKFNGLMEEWAKEDIHRVCNYLGYNYDNLESDFLANNSSFQKFALKLSTMRIRGKVSCTNYAASVAFVAKSLGIDFKVYSGFCLPKSLAIFDREVASYNKAKESGVEHPVMATHVYVEINGKSYEYYNGDTSNIAHIDCIQIA